MRMRKIRERLYESPDGVRVPNQMYIHWTASPCYAFAYYNKQLFVGDQRGKHDHILFGKTIEGFPIYREREDCQYAGRIWVGKKMISFWEYPDPARFKHIITDLEVALDIGIWHNNYNVEIVTDDAGELDTISKMDGDNYYGAWLNVGEEGGMESKIIPVEQYAGSAQRSKEEIGKEHTVSPLLKGTKHVPSGYGSNNPQADSKRKWRMAVPMGDSKQEIGDETLNESPDAVITGPGGTFVPWYSSTNYAFGYLKDKFVIAPGKNAMHRDIPGAARRDFKYPGRVWPDLRVMSFWEYPPNKEEFKKLVDDLNRLLDINIWKETGWRVEIVKNRKTGKVEDGNFDFNDGMVQGAWIQMSQKKAALVSVKNYRGSEDRPEGEKNKEHTVSPLLKTSQNVTPGFGSNNPKAETRFKEKMYAPFESYYPRLNESPDNIGRPEEDLFLDYEDPDAHAFGIYMGSMYVGWSTSNHGEIHPRLQNRTQFEFPGRIWTDSKIISFWQYPENNEELHKVIEMLEYELNMEIWDVPGWLIEVIMDPETEQPMTGRFGKANFDTSDNLKLIPLRSYQKSKAHKPVEHQLSPLNKSSKEVTPGFGSKHPEASKHFKTKMQAPFESAK